MSRRAIFFLLSLMLALPAGLAFAGGPVGGFSGRWLLTEQYYNGGKHNFAADAPALRLILQQDVRGVAGTMLYDDWSATWPAWPTPDGPALLGPGTVVRLLPGGQQVQAEFQVLPAPGDETTLRVRETCTLETADRMRCDVQVSFDRAGQSGGGFTWRRIFAREGDQ